MAKKRDLWISVDNTTDRMKVPGGWLVRSMYEVEYGQVTDGNSNGSVALALAYVPEEAENVEVAELMKALERKESQRATLERILTERTNEKNELARLRNEAATRNVELGRQLASMGKKAHEAANLAQTSGYMLEKAEEIINKTNLMFMTQNVAHLQAGFPDLWAMIREYVHNMALRNERPENKNALIDYQLPEGLRGEDSTDRIIEELFKPELAQCGARQERTGVLVKATRKALNLGLVEFSRQIGVETQLVHKLETGNYVKIDAETAEKLKKFIKANPVALDDTEKGTGARMRIEITRPASSGPSIDSEAFDGRYQDNKNRF
jgi:DNA-binding transcriptional regulator YiaG